MFVYLCGACEHETEATKLPLQTCPRCGSEDLEASMVEWGSDEDRRELMKYGRTLPAKQSAEAIQHRRRRGKHA